MPRSTARQLGQYYHIFNRGNNRENVFVEERNYRHFLRLYAWHVLPVADTYAYCLLPNHFHLLVRIKREGEIETLKTLASPAARSPSVACGETFGGFLNGSCSVLRDICRREQHRGRQTENPKDLEEGLESEPGILQPLQRLRQGVQSCLRAHRQLV